MISRLLYRIKVTGQVQGVGFRWYAASEARKLGITGYVKNIPDGSVYIEAEGRQDRLDRYVEWCRRGPGFSEVDDIVVKKAEPAGYKEFRIER